MKFAICDKDINNCIKAHDMLNDYMNDNYISSMIYSFHNPNVLFGEIEDGSFYDYLLLDDDTVSGYRYERLLKSYGEKITIIYLTSGSDMCDHDNVYYIDKSKKNVWLEVDRILQKTLKERLYFKSLGCYHLKFGGRVIRLPFSEIMYIEHLDSRNIIHMQNNYLYFERKTLTQTAAQMNDKIFLKCHRAFAVNMMYVQQFGKSSFIMKNGDVVPISRKELSFVRERFMQFYYTDYERMDGETYLLLREFTSNIESDIYA